MYVYVCVLWLQFVFFPNTCIVFCIRRVKIRSLIKLPFRRSEISRERRSSESARVVLNYMTVFFNYRAKFVIFHDF